MSYWNNIGRSMAKYGTDAVYKLTTGTVCPCMSSRDSNKPAYSPEWHRLNPTAAACNGTGLISRVVTSTNVKAFFYEVGIVGDEIKKRFDAAVIGLLKDTDLLVIGTLVSSTGAYMAMAKEAVFTIGGSDYQVFHISELMTGDVSAQWAILKRMT